MGRARVGILILYQIKGLAGVVLQADKGMVANILLNEKQAIAASVKNTGAAPPVRTVRVENAAEFQDALDGALPGDRVLLAEGIYRGAFLLKRSGSENAPIQIEAEVAGTALITGTEQITDWVEAEGEPGVWSVQIDLSHLQPAERYGLLAGRREQVFIDGMALHQVLHRDALTGGTFHYDAVDYCLRICPALFNGEEADGEMEVDAGGITGGGTVLLDRNAPLNRWQFLVRPFCPSDHRVEVTTRSRIFATAGCQERPEVSYVRIAGLTFRGSGDAPQQPMVYLAGSHLLMEDCLLEAGAARGLDVRCHHSVMRRCVLRLNGQMGFSGYGTHNLVEDCALLYNNTKHSDFVCFEQGGCKICRTEGWVLRRVRCTGNDGPGLWFDIDNTHALIEQCWCEGNSGPGIMYEISTDATIRNNVCIRNGFAYRKDVRFDSIGNSVGHVEPVYGQGILVQMSRRVLVHNNTCVGNRRCGIELRHHPYQQAGNPNHSTETYRLEDNEVCNNLLADNGWSNLMISQPPVNPSKTDEVRNNRHDYNLFHNTEVLLQYKGNLLSYCRWGKTQSAGSHSLEEWRASVHQDLHSMQWDPFFVAASEKDYRIEPRSPAAGRGRPIDGFHDDYLGSHRPADAPSIGAFEPTEINAASLLRAERETGF